MTDNSSPDLGPALVVVFLEATVAGAWPLLGSSGTAILTQRSLTVVTDPVVVGGILFTFLGAFLTRFKARLGALRRIVGLPPPQEDP